MNNTDADGFKALFEQTAGYYGGKMSGMDIWWKALLGYSLTEVQLAFSLHITDPQAGKFAPLAADIIRILQSQDGHPGVEEAWALVKHALGDERCTLVLTLPMKAAFLAADSLADDKIGARMAFKEVYQNEIRKARASGERLKWDCLLGRDPVQRDEVVQLAVREGRLAISRARMLMAYVSDEAPLLASPEARRRIGELKQKLLAK